MPVLRAVVFDYGHTLVDFTFAEEQLLPCYAEVQRILEGQAYRQIPEASAFIAGVTRRVERALRDSYERQELEELDIVSMFDESLRALEFELPRELVRQIVEMEHRAMVANLHAPPENLAVLGALRQLDLKVGLVSNAHFLPELMREDIAQLGITPYLDDAVFSAEIGVRKPHPAIFLKVLNELGVGPTEAVFVGDRLRDDIGGARALGMRAVLTQQFRREEPDATSAAPDLVIQALPDLLPFVRSLMGREQPAGAAEGP